MVLYDVVYSKEDAEMGAKMLPKYEGAKDWLEDLDKAKFLLVTLEIQQQLGQAVDDRELKALLEVYQDSDDDWEKVKEKYFSILEEK